MKTVTPRLAVAALALTLAAVFSINSFAQTAHDHPGKTFNFKDPKSINGIVFIMDSDLEPIVGVGGGVSGSVHFDPADPTHLHGTINLDPASLTTPNGGMNKHIVSPKWLASEQHPNIQFHLDKVTDVVDLGNGRMQLTADGRLSLRGVEIAKTVTLVANHAVDGAKARGGAQSGDILVLRTVFEFGRADFGIQPEMGTEKVGGTIQIIANIAGYEVQ